MRAITLAVYAAVCGLLLFNSLLQVDGRALLAEDGKNGTNKTKTTSKTFTPTDLSSNTPFLAGVAQFEPVYWRLNETIAKVCQFIKTAGENKVRLLMFAEGVVSGYPWFNWWARTWDMDENEHINQLFILNSVQIRHDGGDVAPVLACAKRAGVNVVLPVNERDNKGSQSAIFNTLLFIDSNGKLVARHRKTTPSYTERFWWSYGQGDDFVVVDMPGVGRVCGLLCWEHYMTLARYTLMAQGCEFWVAPTQDIGPHWVSTVSFIAREARAYVLSATQMFRPEVAQQSEIGQVTGGQWNWSDAMMDSYRRVASSGIGEYMMDGQATITNPDGFLIAGPVYSSGNYAAVNGYYTIDWAKDGCAPLFQGPERAFEKCTFIVVPDVPTAEFILAANVSRGEVQRKKLYQDSVGNYARPDVWDVTWHNKPRDIMFTDEPITHNGLFNYDLNTSPFDQGN